MQPLLIVALVCAATVAPADCTPDVALAEVRQPSPSALPVACLAVGEAVIAGSGLGLDLTGDRYLKITCRPRKG